MEEKVRILCVDDEVNVLNSIRRLFIDEDYEILSATSGEDGLAILKGSSHVRLVIADYRMPGMNGVDFLKEVCAVWPETVRIILSGYADTASIVSAINDGQIYKFIPKPWNDDELKVTVANALGRDSLHRRNAELAEELRRANDELAALKESVEKSKTAGNNILSFAGSVLDSLPLAVIGMDADGKIVICNKKAEALFPGKGSVRSGLDNLMEGVPEAITLEGRRVRIKSDGVTFPDGRKGVVLVFDPDR
jgi:two-component system NtrC family sensor kinase